MEEVLILGTGCAGGTAAIYTARANLKPLVYEGPEPGGQLTLTTEVENFPGFEHGIQGPELVGIIKKQAERFGARFKSGLARQVTKIDGGFETTFDNGDKVQSKTLIVSTGASARWLGLESEAKYKGKGVSTCATCDAFFYKGKPEVLVVGGGDSACEEANFLTKFAEHVTMVVRKDHMRASKIMQDRAINNPKITILYNSEIDEVLGTDTNVTAAKIKNNQTGETVEHPCNGIFLAIGHIPNTEFLGDMIHLDDHGFIKTEFTKTNVEGLYACGDVQDPVFKQAITAAGSGCQAALQAEKYLESLE